jgi:hypothetical protein
VGGFLVAGGWTGLVVAALRAAAARRPPATEDGPSPRTVAAALVPVGAVVAALIATASVLVIADSTKALDYAAGHTTFMVGAAVIALGAMGMSAVASLALART